jgi:antitoxin component YwqK of YwqJK toxin-antitoxin module
LKFELDFSFFRDNDLHRLLFMPNGLPDGAELAYYVKGQVS